MFPTNYFPMPATGVISITDQLIAAIWAAPARTLTQTAAEVAAAVSGSDLTITKAITFNATLTGLNIAATWDKVYFTVKKHASLPDASAMIQIVVSNPGDGDDGLLYVNKTAGTANEGSLVVDDEEGTVAITLTDDASALVQTGTYLYDLKVIDDSVSTLLAEGTATIAGTPTMAVE